MNQEEIVERLRKVTGSWESTFRLLDKYDVSKAESAPCDFKLTPEIPPIHIKKEESTKKEEILAQKEIKYAPKAVRIKRGAVREQVVEIVQSFPDSNLSEIATLGDWRFRNEKHMSTQLQKNLKALCEAKIMVRKKIDGKYAYRLVEKK
jgi:hypothetical protein